MTGDHEHTVHMHMRMHMLITPCVGRWRLGHLVLVFGWSDVRRPEPPG